MKRIKIILIISGLLGFAFAIRVWRVDKVPASVNWDEAALGYNAYSMLKTGRDEFGKAFPVSLRSFDDYKPALYAYYSVPVIAFWGLSEISTRMVSVIFGTLLVFFVLYISAKASGNMYIGLAAGLFTAVSPWAIHFSRIAFETNLATALYYLGISLFVLGIPAGSLLAFILSMYAYHAQRAIAIPTFILLVLFFKKKIKIQKWLTTGLLLAPLVYSFLTEPAGSRLATTNILKLWPFAPLNFPLIIYNPIYSLIWQAVGQFLAYFSPYNIFWRGSQEPILRIPTLGLLPAELFPLWVAGLVSLKNFKKSAKILIIILVLAPLPAVITWNWFSVVRTTALYPTFCIMCALGGSLVFKLPKLLKKFTMIIFTLTFGLSTLFTILTITLYAPWETFGDFQPGFKESVPHLLTLADKYPKVVIDSPHIAPYIFLLFYGKYPPQKYLNEAGMNRKNSGTENYSFGKFEFRKITRSDLDSQNVLLMGATDKLPDYFMERQIKLGNKTAKEFSDTRGYISFRVIGL
jgi:hypothetical protein